MWLVFHCGRVGTQYSAHLNQNAFQTRDCFPSNLSVWVCRRKNVSSTTNGISNIATFIDQNEVKKSKYFVPQQQNMLQKFGVGSVIFHFSTCVEYVLKF